MCAITYTQHDIFLYLRSEKTQRVVRHCFEFAATIDRYELHAVILMIFWKTTFVTERSPTQPLQTHGWSIQDSRHAHCLIPSWLGYFLRNEMGSTEWGLSMNTFDSTKHYNETKGLSNVILVVEILPLFHQYLRYCHKFGTIVFRIAGAILWV